jgi:hypothetical protein
MSLVIFLASYSLFGGCLIMIVRIYYIPFNFLKPSKFNFL